MKERTMAQSARVVEGIEAPPAGKWELDGAHTSVGFVARHMLTKVRGRFTDFSGWIEVGERPEDSRVQVEVRTDSVQTNQEQRDEHMRSGDFFLADEYPVMTFTSTAFRPIGGTGFELDGDLTIRGITRPITLSGEFLGWGPSIDETPILSATASATANREDWGLTWNMVVETGGFLVGKKVDIEIDVEARYVG
jgi:polyisoprenoid-binding protein YceI